ncbi:hypothetical protein AJ80_07151 [Polytolypa hystricis UAMH7299]|uniref:Zn(2)-C6 fungal-type domain-containing protein n=1 Tax=Polytolypa hystricis (strain UAMH7299) TaxID=1447883 RepID=A0A2B7XQW8_POLH7|nr:hypothetical protein AJ80_07151 [Polytolypa hystricis UAMH7299]
MSQQSEWSPGENRIVGNQVVFRIKDARVTSSRAARQPPKEDNQSKDPVYHSRKPHRKSRTGCTNCKKRRVKCDETKPNCRKCQTYGISCDYSALQVQSRSQNLPSSWAQDTSDIDVMSTSTVSLSMTQLASMIESALRLDSSAHKDLGTVPVSVRSKSVFAVHQFLSISADAAALPDSFRDVTCGDMMRVAFQTPYLMHAVLGVATSALSHFLPHDSSYRFAAAYHWQHTLKLYSKELDRGITIKNMDALMSTCMMLGFISYSEFEYRPSDSWVFSDDPKALNWLLVQGGLRYILGYTGKWLEHSIWLCPFMETENGSPNLDDHRPGREGLHPGLADLCDIDDTTTEETSPYHYPLRMLSAMFPLEIDRNSVTKFTGFMGRLLPDYTNLLLKKDPKAIMILAHWLGKMCEAKNTWLHPRVQSECMALCMYLEHSKDPRILKLLEYPAQGCGYLLNHVREEAVFQANFDLIGLF